MAHPNSYPCNISSYVDRLSDTAYGTNTKYLREYKRMMGKFSHLDLYSSIDCLVNNFLSKNSEGYYSSSTYRTYKASIIYGIGCVYVNLLNGGLSDDDLDSGVDENFLEKKYSELINSCHIKSETKPLKTSELKAKFFDPIFFDFLLKDSLIDTMLGVNKNPNEILLKCFVRANLVMGMRPVEWFDSYLCCALDGPELIMMIKNAKSSHGRANGDFRYIVLDNLSEIDKENVFKYWFLLHGLNGVVDQVTKSKGSFGFHEKEKYIRNLGTVMRRKYMKYCSISNKGPGIDRPTLYSTRHQCIANAKSKGVNKFFIAACFGQAGSDTARLYYGPASKGMAGFGLKPTLDSIVRVNNSHEFVRDVLLSLNDIFYCFDAEMEKVMNTIYDKGGLNNNLGLKVSNERGI